jgi:hypothetical protein
MTLTQQQIGPIRLRADVGGRPVGRLIIGALEGAVVVGGLSALGTGLYSIGIPKSSVVQYETALMGLVAFWRATNRNQRGPSRV